jgi:fructose/tagatose bisphosphate aldolase
MEANIITELFDVQEFGLIAHGNSISVNDETKLKQSMDKLIRIAVLESGEEAAWAQYIIHTCALQLGIIPSSIHDLYISRGKGELPSNFTTPAVNLRALSYDGARAAFRSARKINSSLIIFEIARVELMWGGISLAEYASCVLGAAIVEGYSGPVFLQGDHFQVSAQNSLENEMSIVKTLIRQAIRAGFYNIDIDTSTLVDLLKASINDQQTSNALISAELASYTRKIQPQGITVSIGGEIGEVGGHVSTVEELHSYITQFNQIYSINCPEEPGLSKVSIHSGTTHGGIALPDGTIARPTIDFDAILRLSRASQQSYYLGGVVQHGASTLPLEDFGQLVNYGTLEVHLATAFMTTMLENLPSKLIGKVHKWLDQNYAHERTSQMTDSQFYHKVEMNALAPFKKELWDLSNDEKQRIAIAWESQFDQIFKQLGCSNSRPIVDKFIKPVIVIPNFNLSPDSLSVGLANNGLVG